MDIREVIDRNPHRWFKNPRKEEERN